RSVLVCPALSTPRLSLQLLLFFFNDPAPPALYTLSLHDALPICPHGARDARHERREEVPLPGGVNRPSQRADMLWRGAAAAPDRSEEHTSELQSQSNLVCRLLLEKKKKKRQKKKAQHQHTVKASD